MDREDVTDGHQIEEDLSMPPQKFPYVSEQIIHIANDTIEKRIHHFELRGGGGSRRQ